MHGNKNNKRKQSNLLFARSNLKDWRITQLLHALPDEEQSDVGVDEEVSGAEMQDSNWTNSRPAKSAVTVRVSRLGWIKIESNRRTYFMDRQRKKVMKGKKKKSDFQIPAHRLGARVTFRINLQVVFFFIYTSALMKELVLTRVNP